MLPKKVLGYNCYYEMTFKLLAYTFKNDNKLCDGSVNLEKEWVSEKIDVHYFNKLLFY